MPKSRSHSDPFLAIAHPARRRLLELLERGERPVGELARTFPFSLPALSQHLGVLKLAGLVKERREGRQKFYRLAPRPLEEVSGWMLSHQALWAVKLSALGAFLRKKHGPA